MKQERFSEPLMAGAAALVVGLSVMVTCDRVGSFLGPNPGCFEGATPITCNTVAVTVTANGQFEVTANGQTYSASTGTPFRVFNVPVGASEITGSTSADTLTITLSSVATQPNGGVQRGSLTVASGVGGTALACSVTFAIPSGATRPQSFGVRYTVGSGIGPC